MCIILPSRRDENRYIDICEFRKSWNRRQSRDNDWSARFFGSFVFSIVYLREILSKIKLFYCKIIETLQSYWAKIFENFLHSKYIKLYFIFLHTTKNCINCEPDFGLKHRRAAVIRRGQDDELLLGRILMSKCLSDIPIASDA